MANQIAISASRGIVNHWLYSIAVPAWATAIVGVLEMSLQVADASNDEPTKSPESVA